jgi:hypothetical protein
MRSGAEKMGGDAGVRIGHTLEPFEPTIAGIDDMARGEDIRSKQDFVSGMRHSPRGELHFLLRGT